MGGSRVPSPDYMAREQGSIAASEADETGSRKRTAGSEGRMVTKPIIFTFLPLPASRRVILNALSDPWAGFESLENMVSQMKLSQLAIGRSSLPPSDASHLSPIRFWSVMCKKKLQKWERNLAGHFPFPHFFFFFAPPSSRCSGS